jgi:hypothetical protein
MLESPHVVSYRGQATHFLSIGNAKRKRREKGGFIGVFEGFLAWDGKRTAFAKLRRGMGEPGLLNAEMD